MVAARDKYLRETTTGLSGLELEDAIAHKRSKLVALGSEMSHSSVQKGAKIVGVRYRSVPVSKENGYSMMGEDLEKVILQCRGQGLEPFFLGTTLGTTSTCAIDDFKSIESVIAKLAPLNSPGEIWVHVDAAYAGAALVCPEYQHLTSSFEHFHSFDMNMHKWLLTNFDASLLYIRERKDLTDALSITPSYLRNVHSESGLVTDYRDWQIPLGRRFRSLKIWFVLRTYGVKGMQDHVRGHIKLGELFADLLRTRKDLFEVITGSAFALTVFNVVPKKAGKEEQNNITKEVYELVNKRGEIYITHTVLGDIYAIRVVSANEATQEKYIKRAFQILVETTEEVRDGKGQTNGVVR